MLKPHRLDALADGIFAIVMTLLVIEIRVPELGMMVSVEELLSALAHILPLFVSYIMSFATLFTYWMGHHFVMSAFSKNIDRKIIYLNLPFLMCVALIPFSTHFLQVYKDFPIGIFFYGMNVILAGGFLFLLFRYAVNAKTIENIDFSRRDFHFAHIRMMIPPVCAIIAMGVSFYNPQWSLYFYVFAISFNIIPGGLSCIENMVNKIFGKSWI